MTFALIGNFTRLVSLETMNNSNLPKIGSAPPGRLTQHIRRPETSSRKDRHQTSISAAAAAPGAMVQNVEDIMTTGRILTCTPETPLDNALEILVEYHVTGLPVVDADNVVVGVVSDFDLLALEGLTAKEKARGFFPEAETDWNSFFEIQKLVSKNAGKNVGDVMTADPICVRPNTSIEAAANMLLRRKIRRLPVVDENGKLVGIITRSNVIKAAWEARKAGLNL